MDPSSFHLIESESTMTIPLQLSSLIVDLGDNVDNLYWITLTSHLLLQMMTSPLMLNTVPLNISVWRMSEEKRMLAT